ncbi:MAG: TetR/AcrR family transcriptional regulator; helix-turn-helix transcriptional regulator [Candidatus Hydrogenedentes bacterium]|nr:TetR/AcrR family transcriptional regulator; helix-turn-helix transcriptional regulator [Candidatus Hydrogenedentota bacterium]
MARPTCKHIILDAAEGVVSEVGAAHLTLDAVAEKSGVSKGGVLYHFPNKEALIEGMMTRLIDRTLKIRDTAIQKMQDDPASELKAEIMALLVCGEADKPVRVGMLAAVANHPSLMCIIREVHRKRFESQSQYANYEKRALLLLSTFGLFFLELMQVSPFSEEQRARLIDSLFRFADEVAAEC